MKKNNKLNRKNRRIMTDGFCVKAILNNLKTLFLPWIIIAVVSFTAIVGANILFSNNVDSVSATVSFYYNGIENGLDPNGCEFDKTEITDSKLVSEVLSEMNLSSEYLEQVKNGIFVDSIISTSAIDKIGSYQSIYNSNDNNWTEALKDSSYHPTTYNVSFNYNQIGLNGKKAAELLNLLLEKYQKNFFEKYGYNESVCNSVLSIDFNSYDYLIALDMYSSNLSSIEGYINNLAENDKSQFRSNVTGYSFSDLADSVRLIRSVDIDTLTSYILNNGVISDKSMILSYYDYRLDNLKRQKQNATERLNSTLKSINDYQKDSIIVYNNSSENAKTITETSDIYDSLIQNKLQLQGNISNYDTKISDYTDRLAAINKSSANASDSKKKYVESQIESLTNKTEKLIENIKNTANDYFETEKFSNAVTINSHAEYSTMNYIKSALNESIRMIIIFELFLISIYFFLAVAFSFKSKIMQKIK